MLTCRELTEVVTEYLEGRMGLGERVRFHLHVGLCRSCRGYLRQMKVTARTLGRLPEPELPPGVRDELLRRFEGWKSGRR